MKNNQNKPTVKYIAISPVYNEGAYIEGLLSSMLSQTMLPQVWVIVDDGSTDNTAAIVERYKEKHEFIQLLRIDPASKDSDGLARASDAKAFNIGLAHARNRAHEFIVRIEADTSFESDYFERLFNEFERDPRLGIAGGRCLVNQNGDLVEEKAASTYVFGGTKVYRRECFNDIGGMVEYLGWDLIDEVRAQMNGWQTRNFPDINIVHRRQMGSTGGIRKGKIRHGISAYIVGYHPLFMLMRSVRRMADEPYVVGGILMFWGFCLGYIRREQRFPDVEMRKFLRSTQIKRLLSRKILTG